MDIFVINSAMFREVGKFETSTEYTEYFKLKQTGGKKVKNFCRIFKYLKAEKGIKILEAIGQMKYCIRLINNYF